MIIVFQTTVEPLVWDTSIQGAQNLVLENVFIIFVPVTRI